MKNLLCILLWLPLLGFAQGGTMVFSVRNFSVNDYDASSRNWDLAVSDAGILYVANNAGLLVFDGNNWQKHNLLHIPALKKIACLGDKIYTLAGGNKMEWGTNEYGHLDYSLIDAFPSAASFAADSFPSTLPFKLPWTILNAKPSVCKPFGAMYLIGTELDGLFVVNEKGKIQTHLHSQNHLEDNWVRAIFVQDATRVWLALDNGIACISFNSSILKIAERRRVGKLQAAGMYENRIYLKTNTGTYTYDRDKMLLQTVQEEIALPFLNGTDEGLSIEPFDLVNNLISLERFANAEAIYRVSEDLYWFALGNELGLYQRDRTWATLKCRLLFDSYNLHLVSRGQEVFPLSESLHLVSTMEGTFLLDVRRLMETSLAAENTLAVKDIQYADSEGVLHTATLEQDKIVLPYDFSQLEMSVYTSLHASTNHLSYFIEGLSSEWSDWKESGKISLLQLSAGTYRLKLRKYAVSGNFPTKNLTIVVKAPWFNTGYAYVFYLLCLWGVIQLFLKYSVAKLRKEEEIKTRIEQQDDALKLKETKLSIQTTILLKRNQSIQRLLEELNKQAEELGERYPKKMYKRMYKLMQEAQNDKEEQLIFESTFDSAFQNFRSRLQTNFSELTPGDLRICCLLRMNLTTKEIASLMNVSVRAVELRRYRLRKRMDLPQNTNLTDFLISY